MMILRGRSRRRSSLLSWKLNLWLTRGVRNTECGTWNGEAFSGLDENGHVHPHEFDQVFRVPVGEAEATVRFRPAHLLRTGRAVDAVARPVQADPRDTDGIVRPGRQDEFAVQLAGFC